MSIFPKLNQYTRFLFIINPIAGERDKDGFIKLIKDESLIHGWKYELYLTTGKDDPVEIKKVIDSLQPEVIFAVGGDGTVNMVAQMIAGSDIVLGIIPAGSGNGLAKDLKIPANNMQAALEALLNGKIEEIDTLKANDNFFMHLADVGFNAHVVKLFSKSSSRGLTTYMKFVLKEFFKYPTYHYDIETDNGSFSGNAFMITVANSNQFGSNLIINPDGDWADGKFEVIIIKRFPKKQAFMVFWRLLSNKIKFSPYCIIIKCTKAKVRCAKKRTLQFDGEVSKRIKEVNFSISYRNLRIIIP